MKGSSKVKNSVNVTIDEELQPLTDVTNYLIKEFTSYKTKTLSESDGNFVAPNEFNQQQYPSSHSLFGRDRVFDYPPRLLDRIHLEQIAHVHFNIDDSWGVHSKQWVCTSDSSIVYSGFKTLDTFHFVIHDLLTTDAHNSYSQDDMQYYLDNAEYHRKK
jgi:hypothetical protein